MCGIVAYFGHRPEGFIQEALLGLEHRGADSWGVVAIDQSGQHSKRLELGPIGPTTEIRFSQHYRRPLLVLGHTRWATHGPATLENTHPIQVGSTFVVHNGTIDNAEEIWEQLRNHGAVRKGQTDTEAIAAYLEAHRDDRGAMWSLFSRIRGDFALVTASTRRPDSMIIARRGLPLYFTEDGRVASEPGVLGGEAYEFGEGVTEAYRGQFAGDRTCRRVHAPRTISCPRGQRMAAEIRQQESYVLPLELPGFVNWARRYERLVLFGCGSSYHAALLGKMAMERHARRMTVVDYSTAIAEGPLVFPVGAGFVAITQSGETRDTLRALSLLVERGKPCYVLTNQAGSRATLMAPHLDLGCGPERAVAATKTFTATTMVLEETARRLAGQPEGERNGFVLASATRGQHAALVEEVSRYSNVLLLGKGEMYPVALEGALKLKEVAYIHAEAVYLSELKHGPLALIDDHTLVLALLDEDDPRSITNLEEVRARGGRVAAIVSPRTGRAREVCDGTVIEARGADLAPQHLEHVVVLQWLAHDLAVQNNRCPDSPRHIAKAITVD